MEEKDPSRTIMICRFVYAGIGITLGVAVFICFIAMPKFYNLHIALWGFASAIFAFVTLMMHVQHVKGDRDVWVYRLKFFILIGFFTEAACIVAFIVYIILAVVEKQELMPVEGQQNSGFYLAAIWVFMTWKWSFSLFYFSRAYRRNYTTSPESNRFLNVILNGNMLFLCRDRDIPSERLQDDDESF